MQPTQEVYSGKLVSNQVSESILSVIRALFDACGPQCFAEILSEVRTQCLGVDSLEKAHQIVKDSLAYLEGAGIILQQKDEFGIVYGHPSDF